MPIVCAVFGCKNKPVDKSLSFYRFPKVKSTACSDLKAKILAQLTAWYKSLKRDNVLEIQPNNIYRMVGMEE